MGADPDQARGMCLRLAEFLRDSLTLGSEARIPLGREVALAEQYSERRAGAIRAAAGSVTTSIAADVAPTCRCRR